MNASLLRALVLALMLVPAACSMPMQQPDQQQRARLMDWEQRQLYLNGIDSWIVDGRIAMQSGNDAWSASLKWQQDNTDFDLKLYGPLGRKAMSVSGGEGYVNLTTNEGESFSDSSASSLIYRQTGWQVPVENLRYWAMALSVPGQPSTRQYDTLGRLSELSQSGWVVHYQDYQRVDELEMPRKIRLVHRHFTVKLILRDWQLNQNSDRDTRPDV